MKVTCPKCLVRYDDELHQDKCPHTPLDGGIAPKRGDYCKVHDELMCPLCSALE